MPNHRLPPTLTCAVVDDVGASTIVVVELDLFMVLAADSLHSFVERLVVWLAGRLDLPDLEDSKIVVRPLP